MCSVNSGFVSAVYEDQLVRGRMIFKWILTKLGEDVNGMHLAADRDRRQAVVNTVMNILVQ
jgi:hypothetical protein